MKTFARFALIAILLQVITTRATQSAPQSTEATKGSQFAALEKMLLGAWYGPDCGGDYTFNADGTFEVKHFSPGNNTLTGTWSIRWDALPPTLSLTFKTSDLRKNDPTSPEYEYVGKTREQRLLELTAKALVYRLPNEKKEWHFSRDPKEGGSTKVVQ